MKPNQGRYNLTYSVPMILQVVLLPYSPSIITVYYTPVESLIIRPSGFASIDDLTSKSKSWVVGRFGF